MRVRPLGVVDAPACVEVATSVGWRTDETRWRRILAVGNGFGADAADGTLAGTVMLNRFDDALATIAMMVVSPRFQRQGIGRRLMETALSRADDAVVYLYASEVGRILYEKLGFVLDGAETQRVEGMAAIAPQRSEGLRPMRAADFPKVRALDAEAQGGSRGPLLEALCSLAVRAVVVEREGDLSGFGLAALVDGVRLLGPVVAADDADARAIAGALAEGSPEAVRVELEPGERALREWAREIGLAPLDPSARMVLGGGALPGRRTLVRAMAGRAYG